MKKSKRPCKDLDFDRDIVTTPEDMEALRKHVPGWPVGDLTQMDRLSIPFDHVDPKILRRVFPDAPPFEL